MKSPGKGVQGWIALLVRVAVAVGFLSAVADRFGLWGPPGAPDVAWGNFAKFTSYAGRLNPWAPVNLVPAVAWTATVAETALGFALLVGWQVRLAGLLGGILLTCFAAGMTVDSSIKAPFDSSVFAAAGAAFSLVVLGAGVLSVDRGR